MYGKVVESVAAKTWKVLFTDQVYRTITSGRLAIAEDDYSVNFNLAAATSADLETVMDKAEEQKMLVCWME
jgi:hypothetical protein